jgi:hypothetical protein
MKKNKSLVRFLVWLLLTLSALAMAMVSGLQIPAGSAVVTTVFGPSNRHRPSGRQSSGVVNPFSSRSNRSGAGNSDVVLNSSSRTMAVVPVS